MHIEFLVEEDCMSAALYHLVPKIIGEGVSFRVHAFRGKPVLLRELPRRLGGYSSWLPPGWRIVVLVDEDREDCRMLKTNLELAAHEAGFATKTRRAADGSYTVINRIVVEELEACVFVKRKVDQADTRKADHPGEIKGA